MNQSKRIKLAKFELDEKRVELEAKIKSLAESIIMRIDPFTVDFSDAEFGLLGLKELEAKPLFEEFLRDMAAYRKVRQQRKELGD